MNNNLPTSLNEITLPQQLPPIVLVAFTRPELLQQVLDALSQQSLLPQQIIAFVDGPRNDRDQPLIQECISLLESFSEQIPVEIIARSENLGCDRNVISALTEMCHRYPSLIYLEDDVVPNPCFYDRMCRLLEAYRPQSQIFSVSAYATFPDNLQPLLQQDFFLSRRVFALGLGIWADRWLALDLINKPPAYNPFQTFYQIPATIQTKYTIVNQFFLEKNQQTDWVITMTLGALFRNQVHIIPKVSFVRNIGFGHPEAKTYRGAEPPWVNAKFDPSANPNTLPANLELLDLLASPLEGWELVKHLEKNKSICLDLPALLYFWQKYPGWRNLSSFSRLFFSRFRLMLGRWRRSV